MSAGSHVAPNNVDTKPRRPMIWVFGGAAAAVITGGLLMQYWRAAPGQAATDAPPGTARVAQKRELLAKVGSDNISYDMVAAECVARHGKEVLDDLIHRMIIQQACESAKLQVTEEEVSQEIARIANRFKLDITQYLQMLQSERNITPMHYRTSVVWPMLALKKLAGEEVEVTEEEIQKAFVRNYGVRVKARVIMFETVRKANEVWEMVNRNPKDFEKLAQQYSIDPNSRSLGGQVPPIPRYMGHTKLEDEAFKLKKGEISGVVEIGPQRYIVMMCEGHTEPIVTDIDQVRDSLYDELKETKVQQAVGKKFEELKNGTRVDNYLTMNVSGPDRKRAVPGDIQPVNATNAPQQRQPQPAGQARPTATGAAPVRNSKN